MPSPSTIVIAYDNTDITTSVLFSDCSIESQIQATPGAFSITIKDPDRTLGPFVTGKELTVDIDGVRLYGGYVLQVYQTNFFPAVDTSDLTEVHTRQWRLVGMDYNMLMDKRVLRSTTAPTVAIPNVPTPVFDGQIIRNLFPTFFDVDAGFDYATFVQDVYQYPAIKTNWAWQSQGSTQRDQLTDLANFGAFFYYDASKHLHYEPVQALVPTWGFSDSPAASAARYGGTWIGFREGSSIEDATGQVDDALVWGGTPFSNNGAGGIVFARSSDQPTIDAHNRWQLAENHVSDSNYASQAEVQARANTIISGTAEGTTIAGGKGLLLPEKQASLAWYANDVPKDGSGNPLHLVPGAVTTLHLWTFSEDGGTTPFILTLPLKQVKLSFPTLKDGLTYVRFDGFFGIQQNDPYWLWDYLLKTQQFRPGQSVFGTATTVTGPLPTPPPVGSFYSGAPLEPLNGSTTVFHIPFAYVPGSVQVFLNGIAQRTGIDFTESNPSMGEITMTSAPVAADGMIIQARTLGAISGSLTANIPGGIDDTGATDVHAAIIAWLEGLPAGSVAINNPTGIYRCDKAVKVGGLNNITWLFQGSTLDGSHGTDYTEEGSLIYLASGIATNTNVKIFNANLIGSSPTPGTFISGHEGQHGVLIDGGSGFEVAGCVGQAFYGDFAEINSGATNWSVHDNQVINTGRNGLSVIWGNSGSFFNNSLPHCGYMPFDVEPNVVTEPCFSIDIHDCPTGFWTNLLFAVDGSSTGADIHDITLKTITSTGKPLRMEINPSGTARESNMFVIGCTSDTAASGPVMQFTDVDGVTVTGNTQPLSSGALTSTPGCTAVSVGPNP